MVGEDENGTGKEDGRGKEGRLGSLVELVREARLEERAGGDGTV